MGLNTLNQWHNFSTADFHQLAEEYGTPFFLYDADAITDRIKQIRELFEHRISVYYAVKANPNLALLRAVNGIADGLDISSGGELEQAVLADFDMTRLSFAGPAKTTDELTASIERGVGCLSIESSREIMESVAISKRLGVQANIVIRVNPRFLNRTYGIKMGGRSIQFGIDEEYIDEIVKIIMDNREYLKFKGIHIYAGSQCFDVSGIVEGVENTLRIATEIEAASGLMCQSINLGGGFGVSHTEAGRELDVEALAQKLLPRLKAFQDSAREKREIIFELGRYLTADAGIYVTQVISSKESRGKIFFMVDGGLHHHLAAAGTFGTALRSNFILQNISHPEESMARCSVAGPSCNPTDLLGIDVELPKPEQGDLLGVLKSGSYGLTASPLLFLGRQTPAEVVRYRGHISLSRKVRTMIDFN